MTGIGRAVCENESWKVSSLIKSLNSKGLDISIKSNYNLSPLEMNIRKLIRDSIARGTVSVQIEITPKKASTPVDIGRVLLNIQMVRIIAKEMGLKLTDDTVFQIAWRYSEKITEELSPELEECLYTSLQEAIKDLVNSRREEGKHLKEDMEARVRKIEDLLDQIEKRKEEVLNSIKNRIIEKAKELGLPDTHHTVLSEITFILSRIDVDEEITRLKAHIQRIKSLLNSEGEVGRKLDFTLQELHREINTLGNKLPEFSQIVVEIKSEIDRLKQQVANVE